MEKTLLKILTTSRSTVLHAQNADQESNQIFKEFLKPRVLFLFSIFIWSWAKFIKQPRVWFKLCSWKMNSNLNCYHLANLNYNSQFLASNSKPALQCKANPTQNVVVSFCEEADSVISAVVFPSKYCVLF